MGGGSTGVFPIGAMSTESVPVPVPAKESETATTAPSALRRSPTPDLVWKRRKLRFVRVLRPRAPKGTDPTGFKPTPEMWEQSIERTVSRVMAAAYHDQEELVILESLGLTQGWERAVNTLTRVHKIDGSIHGFRVEPGWTWVGYFVGESPKNMDEELIALIRLREYPDLPRPKSRQ